MTAAATLPQIGDTIEDETGWWQVVAVEPDEVTLIDKHGAERWVSPAKLGPTTPAY